MCFGEEEKGKDWKDVENAVINKNACCVSDSDTYKARFEKGVHAALN